MESQLFNSIGMDKKFLYLQAALIGGGVVFSWTALAGQFSEFYNIYGTIFRFRDCAVPNPLATPCFYGALAFAVAFIWSVLLVRKPNLTSARWLRNFLLFGVVFALSVLAYEAVEYYRLFASDVPSISCSPGTPPYATPCFYGALIFIASYAAAYTIVRRGESEAAPA